MQSQCAIDHLVVAAATLDAGAEYVRATLGVEPEVGGTHERMGTHNRLLRASKLDTSQQIASSRHCARSILPVR
jgi:hypothetical protein